jgi:predicted amino acid-binding ACT domain protein
MSIRHLDRVGVLAHTFTVFAKNGWNVQELENVVFKERQACVANIRFSGDLANMNEAMAELKLNENILDITL